MTMRIPKSWHETLEGELSQPYISDLKKYLEEERSRGAVVYPTAEAVFSAFSYCSFDQVKVVIMGQDPYHGPNQAQGLCFSVSRGLRIPPSLKNIYKELESDLGIKAPNHGSLVSWAKQGVLLLNATLTVRAGEPKSHYGQGWERFTDSVIEKLCKRKDPIVFLLWGKSAKEKCENSLNCYAHPHAVLTCAHPSPYSATNFLGCRHFSKANDFLKKWGNPSIDWEIP